MLAVILDMDGLMVKTPSATHSSMEETPRLRAGAAVGRLCRGMIGLAAPSRRFIIRELGEDVPMAALEAAVSSGFLDDINRNGVPPKPGLFELLDFLDRHGIPRAVATSSSTSWAERLLAEVGVLQRVDAIVGGEQVAAGKPAPDIFLRAAERLGQPASDCVVLEDSGPGLRAAAAAGMKAILVPDCAQPSAEERGMAWRIAGSLLDAISWLDTLRDSTSRP